MCIKGSFSAQQIVYGFYVAYVFDAFGCRSVNGYDLSLSFDCVVFQEAFLNQQLQVSVDLGITQLSLVHDVRLYSAVARRFQDFGDDVMSVSTLIVQFDGQYCPSSLVQYDEKLRLSYYS